MKKPVSQDSIWPLLIGSIETIIFSVVLVLNNTAFMITPFCLGLFIAMGSILAIKMAVEAYEIQQQTGLSKTWKRFMQSALLLSASCFLFATIPFLKAYYIHATGMLIPAIPGILFLIGINANNSVNFYLWKQKNKTTLANKSPLRKYLAYLLAFFAMKTFADKVIKHHLSGKWQQAIIEARLFFVMCIVVTGFILNPLSLLHLPKLLPALAWTACALYALLLIQASHDNDSSHPDQHVTQGGGGVSQAKHNPPPKQSFCLALSSSSKREATPPLPSQGRPDAETLKRRGAKAPTRDSLTIL
jgi:hypothetical protein